MSQPRRVSVRHAIVAAIMITACTQGTGPGPAGPSAPTEDHGDITTGDEGHGGGMVGIGGASYGGATYGAGGGRAPTEPSEPAPTSFDACAAPDACVVIFAGVSCVPSGPVAVAKDQIAAFQRTHAHPSPACAIGGPDDQRRVMQARARWGVTCNVAAQRCELVDHADQDPRSPHKS